MARMRAALRIVRGIALLVQALLMFVSLYQAAVTVLGRRRQALLPAPDYTRRPRFGLIVCARNERPVVANIVADLLSQNYPIELFTVIVVAHNCDDETAAIAKRAGAHAIELRTPLPGKAQVIRAGATYLGDAFDYYGVFDADSRVDAGMLLAVATRGGGEDCVQLETVPHPPTEWISEGYALGRNGRNVFWWRPREALGLGTTISGCGFFIRPALLAGVLDGNKTLTEDLEMTARLSASGRKVAYLSAERVRIGETHDLAASLRQRLRWVRGHLGVLRHRWPALARQAARGDMGAFDLALYMVVPTRVITRTSVTGSFLLSIVRAPFALPLAPLLVAVAGEWVLPAVVAHREKLVPLTKDGIALAFRHGLLGLLWFPIGAWALVTAKLNVWEEMPRVKRQESDASAV